MRHLCVMWIFNVLLAEKNIQNKYCVLSTVQNKTNILTRTAYYTNKHKCCCL